QPEEPQDRRVSHPNAAVGDATGQDLRLIRPVNADEPAAGPVGEDRRTSVQAEGARPVCRHGVTLKLLADVEIAPRGGPPRLPDADHRAEDRPPPLVERRAEAALADRQ